MWDEIGLLLNVFASLEVLLGRDEPIGYQGAAIKPPSFVLKPTYIWPAEKVSRAGC